MNLHEKIENASKEETTFVEDREGYVGWYGVGGSLFQWHPEMKIGFAFVPTSLHWFDCSNLRGATLQRLVKECATKNSPKVPN